MKISSDGSSRTYTLCKNCPQAQLTPDHFFACQAILASLYHLDAPPHEVLYSPQAPDLAAFVLTAFGSI